MLDTLIARCRRRLALREILTQAGWASVGLFGSVIALLAAGAQIFEWWVLPTLGLATLGVVIVRSWGRIPTRYAAAVYLDRRCGYSDALSTAVHFRGEDGPIFQAQRERALRLASGAQLKRVMPLSIPRSVYLAGGLAVIALSVAFLRYGTERKLEFSASLAHVVQDPLDLAERSGDDITPRSHDKDRRELLSRLGVSTPDSPETGSLDALPGTALASGNPNSKSLSRNDPANPQMAGAKSESGEGEGEQEPGASSEAASGSQKNGDDRPGGSREGAPQSAQGGAKSSNASPSSSGLMSKLRDAVSSLLSKMKPQGNPANPQAAGQKGQQQASGKQPSGNSKDGSSPSQDGAKSGGEQADGNQAGNSEFEQMAPGAGNGKSDEQNASAKPGSGMGKQDGNKDVREAEQLAAMGKISELIGKRAQNVSGEMTVETESGSQQLKTGYTRSSAKHGEAGGDSNRDEIPVAMQEYVQSYFEQVRKQAVKTARTGKAVSHP